MRVYNVVISGLEESIRASKYPMAVDTSEVTEDLTDRVVALGHAPAGSGHDQFLTGITVSFDLMCTIKMWTEMERYTFVNFVSSQSTMHKIANMNIKEQCHHLVSPSTIKLLVQLASEYNMLSDDEKNSEDGKQLYLKILYNVPVGMHLTARLVTNYRALKTIYHQRKNHRLPEWRFFCYWIESLPHFAELILA